MPLVENFRATTVWKAFVLNSIASALTIVMAMVVHDKLDGSYKKLETKTLVVTWFVAFTTSFLAFGIMHFITGFGAGMEA